MATPLLIEDRRPQDFEWPYPTLKDRLKRRLSFLLAAPEKIKGVDVAPDYQKDKIVDIGAMRAAGYVFAIVQVNRGLWVHPNLMEFCAPLIAAGMPILTYALFYGTLSGEDQADFHLNHAYQIWQAQGMRLPAMLDIEVRDGVAPSVRVGRSNDWAYVVNQEVKPMKYISPALNTELLDDAPLGLAIGHVAHWTPALEPTIPTGWTKERTLFWQYGVATKYYWCPPVPGVTSAIDVDYFFGSMGDLLALQTAPYYSASDSPSPSASPSEEDVDITKVVAARDLLNQFIAENQGQPSPPSASASPSPSPSQIPPQPSASASPSQPVPPGDTWIMTIKAVDRAKTWTYQVWNDTQNKLVEKRNASGFPIMQEYFNKDGKRLTIPTGTQVETKIAVTEADGSVDYYQLIDYVGDRGQTLYVAKYDVTKPF